LLVLAGLLICRPAASQPADSTSRVGPLSESLRGAPKAAYDAARALVATGDFAGGLEKFREAYEGSQDGRLLYDMAICERNLRHFAAMRALLRRYLQSPTIALSPEQEQAVEDALAALTPLVARVTVDVSEPGAGVFVDGASVGTAPLSEPLVVDLGKHRITASKEGFEGAAQTADLAGGSQATIVLRLVAARSPAHWIVTTAGESTVLIDGTVAGKGRVDTYVAPGAHDLQITEVGKVPYRARVTVGEGEMKMTSVTLEDVRHRVVWPWVAGGIAVAAAAALGGYFLFKSENQGAEPPAGALGTIHLSVGSR